MCRLIMKRPPTVKSVWPHERGRQLGRTKGVSIQLTSQPSSALDSTHIARKTSNSRRSFIPQRSCAFLNLPRELRDEIYCLLLPSHTTLNFAAPTWADNAAGRFFNIPFDLSQCSLIILALCQQIRDEANAVLYGTNRFEFSIGRGHGPSPFNTVRALPQSGISQIKVCIVHTFVSPWLNREELREISGWMNEMCNLLKKGGNLQEIEVEIGINYVHTAKKSDLVKFRGLLKPLEGLNGLESAKVTGLVAEAYRAEFKRNAESDGTRKYKKRKAGTNIEEEVVLRPKKRRVQ